MKWPPNIRAGQLVEVVWRDIASIAGESSWMSKDTLLEEAEKQWDDESVTVGYLVAKRKNYIVLAATKDGTNYADASMIPTSVLMRIQKK